MVSGALITSGARLAVAVTGIAGPSGGTPDKPVGTVWIAWKRRGGYPKAEVFHFDGDREAVRRQTVAGRPARAAGHLAGVTPGLDGRQVVSSNTTNHGPDRNPASHPRPDRRAHRARRACRRRRRRSPRPSASRACAPRSTTSKRSSRPARSSAFPGEARGIRLVDAGRRPGAAPSAARPTRTMLRLPVLGRVAAGVPDRRGCRRRQLRPAGSRVLLARRPTTC